MSPAIAFQVWIASQMRAKERVAPVFGRLGVDPKDVQSAAGLLKSARLLAIGQSIQRFHEFLGEPLRTTSSGDSYNDRGDIYRFEMWPHHDCVLLSGNGAFGLVEFRQPGEAVSVESLDDLRVWDTTQRELETVRCPRTVADEWYPMKDYEVELPDARGRIAPHVLQFDFGLLQCVV
jgi:hypothetical protein